MHSVRLAAALLFSHLLSPARNTASGFPLTFSPCSEPSPSVFSSLAIITLPSKSDMWFSSCLRNHFVFLSFHCTVYPFTCFHTFIFSFSHFPFCPGLIHMFTRKNYGRWEMITVKVPLLRNETFSPHTPPAVWRCSISASCCLKYPNVDFCLVWSRLIWNRK